MRPQSFNARRLFQTCKAVQARWLGLCFVGSLIGLSGCSQSIAIQTIEPAKVAQIGEVRHLSVMPFANDHLGVADQVEAALSQASLHQTPYFTLANRQEQAAFLAEHRNQRAGLIDPEQWLAFGKMMGVDGLVTGRVNQADQARRFYYETRERCLDDDCDQTVETRVRCQATQTHLGVALRLSDVESAEILYAKTYQSSQTWHHCRDQRQAPMTRGQRFHALIEDVADAFVKDLTPHYRTQTLPWLARSKAQIDWPPSVEQQLEQVYPLAKAQRYQRAQTLLEQAWQQTSQASFWIAYHLGVVLEAQGLLAQAKAHYLLAEQRMVTPVEAVTQALVRIEQAQEKQAKVQSQWPTDNMASP